jgi:hypothetical protein
MRRLTTTVICGLGFGGSMTPARAQMELPALVGVRVPLPPSPVAAMGHTYLGHELHLASFAPVDLTLTRVDSAGHTFVGDSAKKEDFYGHGQDALAVTDGMVAVASDAVPDNEAPHPFKCAVPNAGEHVAQRLARRGYLGKEQQPKVNPRYSDALM